MVTTPGTHRSRSSKQSRTAISPNSSRAKSSNGRRRSRRAARRPTERPQSERAQRAGPGPNNSAKRDGELLAGSALDVATVGLIEKRWRVSFKCVVPEPRQRQSDGYQREAHGRSYEQEYCAADPAKMREVMDHAIAPVLVLCFVKGQELAHAAPPGA